MRVKSALSGLTMTLWVLLLLPSAAHAQAQAVITGTVRDSSGAVLPGVTVEVQSPALIEKVRSAVTDGSWQYRVVALPPGAYTVTFTLPGFSTARREGIELTGAFVATVNVDLRVGELAETIVVSGESPVVDVQSTKQQTTITTEVMDAIPSARSINALTALLPAGTMRSDVGGNAGGSSAATGAVHGSVDGSILSDGLTIGYYGSGAAISGMYMPNFAGSQEVVYTTSGGLGETAVGGPTVNLIPREGGNLFSGSFFATGTTNELTSSNYSQELRDQGLTAPNSVRNNWDVNATFGGAISRDKLWFFLTGRSISASNYNAGLFVNKNAGNPNRWDYDPDLSRQSYTSSIFHDASLRLTWQATRRNKISVLWDEQYKCISCDGASGALPGAALISPEAVPRNPGSPTRVQQASWTAPVTNRLLLEAGVGTYNQRWSWKPRTDGSYHPDMIQVQEQGGLIPGLTYRASGYCFPTCLSYAHDWSGTLNWRASLAYVTGAHSLKFGYLDGHNTPSANNDIDNGGILRYRFNNGVPNLITLALEANTATVFRPLASYAQDQWTVGRLTLQGGVRYERDTTHFTGGDRSGRYPVLRPNTLIPQGIVFSGPEIQGVNFQDITPRIGASYDLLGNGKTAVKAFLGKYMVQVGGATQGMPLGSIGDFMNPVNRMPTNTTRSWADNNRNYVPDCDLANPLAQGPAQTGVLQTVDTCGAYADLRFGREFSTFYDPSVTTGWGARPYNWNFSAAIQQELLPRVSLDVAYFRRWFGNFWAIDNREVTASDFTPFSLTVTDPKLPGGRSTVSNLFDVNPLLFGRQNNLVTALSELPGSPEQVQRWHGVDINVNARLANLMVQGGTSTGRQETDTCEVRALLPETAPTNPYCHVVAPFQTQLKGLASYTVPRVDVQVSGTWQSIPGSSALAANYVAPVAQTTLGRPLAGGSPVVVVNLVAPSTLTGDRSNQIDLRFAKILRFGRTRTQIGFDLYNAFNAAPIQGYNQTFGPRWLTPTGILQGRVSKFSGQIDF